MKFIYLDSAFSLITPDPGLALWSLMIFVILMLLLAKFAFRPILQSLKDRQTSIETALNAANRAKEEMSQLQAKNEELLKQAKEERNQMLIEAKEISNKMIEEAREKAKVEYARLIDNARSDFEAEKTSAIMQVKNEAGKLAVEIAEKLIRKELSDKSAQQNLINTLVNEAKLN